MEYHSVLSKVSYVFDQYIYYKLVPEKGYTYSVHGKDLTITYQYNEAAQTKISFDVYLEKKNQLFDFIRKAAKAMIMLDAYSKVTIRQRNCDGEEFVEEVY